MKIRQCFLKLQLKMSGMFFETHCINRNLEIQLKTSPLTRHQTGANSKHHHGRWSAPKTYKLWK